MDRDELEQMAAQLTQIIMKGLGSRSRWALKIAIDAATTEGVGGVCTMRIPPKRKDELELIFNMAEGEEWTS